MIRLRRRRFLLLASALLAPLALSGCALPYPFGTPQHHDQILSKLTTPEVPPPELVREQQPYPTALSKSQAQAAKPLPLQQTGTPIAKQLDPNQLAGRLPMRFEKQATVQSQPEPAAENQPQTPSQPVNPPITLDVTTPSALANALLPSPDKSWPVNTPLGSLNTLQQQPTYPQQHAAYSQQPPAVSPPTANVKPVAHFTPVVETPPQPFTPPTFVSPSEVVANVPAANVPAANVPGVPQSPPTPPTEPASPSDATETAEVLLPKLIASLQKEIRERTERKELDQLPALQQKLRLLQLVGDETDSAVDQIEQMPPAEREAFKQLMFALTTWMSPDDAKRTSLRNAKILRSLHEANERLSAVSKLDLKNLMFCEKVESFGWYTEFPRAEFTPKQQVILYVEVQNFAAEEKNRNAFETELQGSYQIFDASGSIVDERQLPLDREVCRNFRRDYFLAYRIYLPNELAAGRYRLELAVEDLKAKKDFKGRKQGEAMIEFTIK
ncbi:hypothetical protein [Anatilimnocola floriformis]|uniref:hypothetical protein n=1 Tax=Anatilimnocola floriformis TaxID=2948575 RepID=UPI0020C3E193|nr:hypothetical protein [Anatilimnocola floriformis]